MTVTPGHPILATMEVPRLAPAANQPGDYGLGKFGLSAMNNRMESSLNGARRRAKP